MAINRTNLPIFKGLQKPLEFMGIRGRFLIFAAATIGLSFIFFIIFSIILSKLAGFIALFVSFGIGLAIIYTKQKQGLHNKRIEPGIYIYKLLRKAD